MGFFFINDYSVINLNVYYCIVLLTINDDDDDVITDFMNQIINEIVICILTH